MSSVETIVKNDENGKLDKSLRKEEAQEIEEFDRDFLGN